MAALIAGGAIAFDAHVLSYQPLAFGGFAGADGASVHITTPDGDWVVFTSAPSAEFTIIEQWRNTGDRAVRITDLPQPFSPLHVEHLGVYVSDPDEFVQGRDAVVHRLRPFTLPAGEMFTVRYRARFGECIGETDPIVAGGQGVRPPGQDWAVGAPLEAEYEVWGIGRTALMPGTGHRRYALAMTGVCPNPGGHPVRGRD